MAEWEVNYYPMPLSVILLTKTNHIPESLDHMAHRNVSS
jgi:hypothetical protein